MREMLTRAISGIVYVALVVLSAPHREYFIVLFFIFAFICLVELMPMIRLKQWLIYPMLPIAYFFLVWYDSPMWTKYILLVAVVVVNLYLIRDLIFLNRIPLFNTKKHVIALLYMIGSSIFLALLPNVTETYQPEFVVGIFAMIWANDTFAYLTGKNFGRTKLFERISPKKTVEGFTGGVIATILLGIVLYYLVGIFTLWEWIGLSTIVAVFGTLGDLIQSKIKRQAAVKDSGSIMPGHGGIFDRMDSVIFAAPFAYLFITLVHHVS
jgi:phosphatidate cytidylyltransferase